MSVSELTNKRQDEILKAKFGDGSRKAKAKLTALRPIKTKEGCGIVWLCRCDCGGTREVLARDFTYGRIKKCEKCVNPTYRNQHKLLTKKKKEQAKSLGDPWYSEEFQNKWREILALFNPVERYLYEVITNGRTQWVVQMQAVQIVHLEENPIDELQNYSAERRLRARLRLQNQGTSVPEIKKPEPSSSGVKIHPIGKMRNRINPNRQELNPTHYTSFDTRK